MRRLPVLILLIVAGIAGAASPTLEPLGARQIPELLKAPAHGERIIMLWALDCVYCEPNMRALARLQRAHPRDIQLVTVATDSSGHRKAVATRLREAGMDAYPAWIYTEATPQRLNFLIDPDWGGETPRTIVILADGERAAASGELSGKQLRRLWPLPRGAGGY